MQFVDHVVKGPKTILTHPTIQDMDTDPGYEEMGRRRFFVDSANWGGGGGDVRLPPPPGSAHALPFPPYERRGFSQSDYSV